MHDDTQPSRVFEMAKSLQEGIFPVRWVQDLGFNYGYPIFNFYGPFPYYTGGLFSLLGFDALMATKMMFGIAIIAAGMGMYFFIRSFLGELPAIAAGTIYLLFPYFAVNIFVRGAVGEFYAYSCLPYVFWGLFKIYYQTVKYKSFSVKWIIFSAAAIAVLTVSHNLSAYMLGLVLLFFFLFALIFGTQKKSLFLSYSIVIFLAFLLSAFYIVPAFFEKSYTEVASQTSGGFQYFYHFVCPIQLWESPWGYGGSTQGCVDGLSFRLGKSDILFAAFGICFGIYFVVKKSIKEFSFLFFFSIFILFLSLFMSTNYSQFLWAYLPNISYLQFPWRFLNLSGLALAILTGFFIFFIQKAHNVSAYVGTAFVIFATILLNLKLFLPQVYNNKSAADYTDKQQISFYVSNITSEYMPPRFFRPPHVNDIPSKPLEISNGKGDINVTQDKTTNVQAKITMQDNGKIKINRAYFPAWNLFVDYQKVPVVNIPSGMQFPLSMGKHIVSLKFVQTPIEKLGDFLSLTGVIAVLAGIITKRKIFRHE